jgi:DNA-binding MarR family transcriptional regulator
MRASSEHPLATARENGAPPPLPSLGPEHLLVAIRSFVRDEKQGSLNLRQLAVLLLLASTPGPHTIRGCAAILRVAKPAVTRSADRLELLGLAERLPDPDDGRSIRLRATRKGMSLSKALRSAIAAELAQPVP